ncbi:MAG: hypothetical protein ACJ796_11345 [Gemmatimonadaceae bacterium]
MASAASTRLHVPMHVIHVNCRKDIIDKADVIFSKCATIHQGVFRCVFGSGVGTLERRAGSRVTSSLPLQPGAICHWNIRANGTVHYQGNKKAGASLRAGFPYKQ